MQMNSNHEISTVGRSKLIVTCTPTKSIWGTECKVVVKTDEFIKSQYVSKGCSQGADFDFCILVTFDPLQVRYQCHRANVL